MRTITDFVKMEPRVWLFLSSGELCRSFLRQANEEGFRFGDLPCGRWAAGQVIGVHAAREMERLPIFIWRQSFSAEFQGVPTRVDYERHIAGEEDSVCRESHFTQV